MTTLRAWTREVIKAEQDGTVERHALGALLRDAEKLVKDAKSKQTLSAVFERLDMMVTINESVKDRRSLHEIGAAAARMSERMAHKNASAVAFSPLAIRLTDAKLFRHRPEQWVIDGIQDAVRIVERSGSPGADAILWSKIKDAELRRALRPFGAGVEFGLGIQALSDTLGEAQTAMLAAFGDRPFLQYGKMAEALGSAPPEMSAIVDWVARDRKAGIKISEVETAIRRASRVLAKAADSDGRVRYARIGDPALRAIALACTGYVRDSLGEDPLASRGAVALATLSKGLTDARGDARRATVDGRVAYGKVVGSSPQLPMLLDWALEHRRLG
jgi:hypothetical protein